MIASPRCKECGWPLARDTEAWLCTPCALADADRPGRRNYELPVEANDPAELLDLPKGFL